MSSALKKIFQSRLTFEGADNSDKFTNIFCDLYRIDLFKDGLDLIVTKTKEKDLKFDVKIIKGWDTNVGCYLTEQSKVYNKILGTFSSATKKTIILRQLTHSLFAHEMAHALEFESGLDLGQEFRKCIGLDMKNRSPKSLPLKAQIKRLMVDALKAYPEHQFISELFARYFELLSTSRDVCAHGDYTTNEVMDFFANTNNFIEKRFNLRIKPQINLKIAAHTAEIAQQVKLSKNEKSFQEKVDSFHQKSQSSSSQGTKRESLSWSKNVKSNADWQSGWNKYKEIQDSKK